MFLTRDASSETIIVERHSDSGSEDKQRGVSLFKFSFFVILSRRTTMAAAATTTTTTPRRPFIFLFFFLHFWSRSLRCELFELRLIQKMFLLLLFLFCDSNLSSSTSGLHHHAGAFARIFHGPFHLCFFFVFLYFSSRFFLCRV